MTGQTQDPAAGTDIEDVTEGAQDAPEGAPEVDESALSSPESEWEVPPVRTGEEDPNTGQRVPMAHSPTGRAKCKISVADYNVAVSYKGNRITGEVMGVPGGGHALREFCLMRQINPTNCKAPRVVEKPDTRRDLGEEGYASTHTQGALVQERARAAEARQAAAREKELEELRAQVAAQGTGKKAATAKG